MGTDWRDSYLSSFNEYDYQGALEKLEVSPISQDEKSQLLYLMEKATLNFHLNNCEEASDLFHQAKQKSQELRTISISSRVGAFFTGDSSDHFTGTLFEQSYLYFFSAINHYQCSFDENLSSSQRRSFLFKARADILAWDNYFQTLRRDLPFKTLYFNDTFAKLYGAMIHEELSTRSDDQIALQLYQDAYDVSQLLAFQYSDYYENAGSYAQELFSQLKNKDKYQVEKENVTGNKLLTDLQQYIFYRQMRLAKKIRPGMYRSQKSKIKELPQRFQDKLAGKEKGRENAVVLISEHSLGAKKAKKINLSIKAAFDGDASAGQKAFAVIGFAAINLFAMEVLNLRPSRNVLIHHNAQTGEGFYGTTDLISLTANEAALAFEVFEWPHQPVQQPPQLLIQGEEETEPSDSVDLLLAAPVGALAERTAEESASQRIRSQGMSFVTKHLISMAAAYTLYKSLEANGSTRGFAGVSALMSYLAATKGFERSHRADTRYWTTLPRRVWIADIDLPSQDKLKHLYLSLPERDGKSDSSFRFYQESLGKFSGVEHAKRTGHYYFHR